VPAAALSGVGGVVFGALFNARPFTG